MKNNINYSTYIVIPNDSVPAAILEKYPALDTGDHRVLGTLARYISQMGCSLLYAATESSYSSTTRTATCSL